MESEQEIHSAFSTLNVNAVEFVPNFGPVVKEAEPETDELFKEIMETPENNGNGKSRARLRTICFSNGKKLPHRMSSRKRNEVMT